MIAQNRMSLTVTSRKRKRPCTAQ